MKFNAVSNKEHHLLLSVSGQFSFPLSVGVRTHGWNMQVYQPWGYNSIWGLASMSEGCCNSLIPRPFGFRQDYSTTDSLDAAENTEENEGTDVYFEILTNWGNPNYLGLTEVRSDVKVVT